jgi:hypothetical protein
MNKKKKKRRVVAEPSNKIKTKRKTISIVKDLNMITNFNSNKELNQKTEPLETICQGPPDKPKMRRKTHTNNSLVLNSKCRTKTFKRADIHLTRIMYLSAFVKDV